MNFQIETTSFCNLTCPECPNWTMERERKTMTTEVFEKILHSYVIPFKNRNRNAGHNPTVIMHKDGEPLLNKRLPDFLRSIAAADPDLRVDIYSHGLLLKRDFIDFLGTLPNKMRLLVSFHFFNHDGSQNDYTATTALLMDLFNGPRQKQPSNVEFILASHLVRPMTADKLNAWKQTWEGPISARRVTVHANTSINPWTGLIEEPGCTSFDACPYGDFGHMFFGATGNVIACCLDLEEEIVFGNVMDAVPMDMIQALNEFYSRVSRKDLQHQVCRYCLGVEKRPVAIASAGVQV